MANGGARSLAWGRFDEKTRLDLAINELDQIYGRLESLSAQSTQEHSQIRQEFTNALALVKTDFRERIDLLRKEAREGFEEIEKRQSRNTSWLLGAVGGILIGLVLLVAQLASA